MSTAPQSLPSAQRKEIYYFITYGICFISLGFGMSALGPMLPYLADNVSVSIAQISFLFTANSLGYLIGSAGGGRFYDRHKGHVLMLIALALMIIMSTVLPLVAAFNGLLIVMFFFGLGMGLLDIGGNLNLLWVYQSRVGPFMNALHFCFGVGAFLSPIILHSVRDLAGGALTWPYWTLALLFLPGIAGLISLSSPKNPEADVGENQAPNSNLRLVILMSVLLFLYVGIETGFGGMIFTYATKGNIVSESSASYINSIYWGALTLGRLITILLARKYSPAIILAGNFSLSVLFLGLILIWPSNVVMIWVVSTGLGLALSSVFPTLLALGETRMKITGSITGWFFFGSSLGGTLLPMLLGQVFEYIGSYQMMITLFVATFIGLLVLIGVILASNKAGEKARI